MFIVNSPAASLLFVASKAVVFPPEVTNLGDLISKTLQKSANFFKLWYAKGKTPNVDY